MHLLTTVIPVYNCEKYIGRAIESVLAQDNQDLEILVIDDGSTDSTASIVREFMEKNSSVRMIQQNNKGVSAARNTGIQNADGTYLSFLDADDYYVPNVLSEQWLRTFMQENADVGMFCSLEANRDGDRFAWDQRVGNGYMRGGGPFPVSGTFASLIYKRQLLLDNQILFDVGIHIGEDQVFKIKALYKASLIHSVDRVLYVYQTNADSALHTSVAKYSYDRVVAWKLCYEWLAKDSQNNQHDIMMAYVRGKILSRLLLYAQDYIKDGHSYEQLYQELAVRNELPILQQSKGSEVSADQVTALRDFQNNPKKFVSDAKKEKIKINSGRALLNVPAIRHRRDLKRYPISEEEYQNLI